MNSLENNPGSEHTSSEIPDGVSLGSSAEVATVARLQMQVPQTDAATGGLLGAANQPIFPTSAAHVVSIQQVQQWQSPFPPPKDVKEYEAVLPGAFDRMVTMVEQSQGAQIESERAEQKSLRAYSLQGTLLGGLITLGAMACSLVCVFRGAFWVAGAFLSVPVMSVAKAFIEGARSRVNSLSATTERRPSGSEGTPVGLARQSPVGTESES